MLNVRGRLQEHLDNSYSVKRLRLEVLDVVNGRGEISLCNADDTVSHVFRQETGKSPDNADNRNVDIRKNIGWGAKDCERPHDEDEDGHYNECVGSAQSKPNNPHDSLHGPRTSGSRPYHGWNKALGVP